ncbi:ABC transporter substrate-binding protein [Yinghuangia sp. ASG 101]|uniref:ABC transporter substrate-binding protein n=1 Tax=Yinghuangia sp. ASG 101 TaxID=2896848 RepID=UPI001E6530AB|nr:ABC transporter substrate-binding protein [Yinghuangia sp. ASG 101]UGQ12363.1 ABC transporter substrate-binding protein [Yinghuangia sp. ASG 101]
MLSHHQRRRTPGRVLRAVRFGITAALIAVTAACADSSGGGTPSANATPRTGGDITMLVLGDARGLNPYTASTSPQGDGSKLSALYDVLLWSDPATGTVRPQMAESMVADRDSLVWTLTLRADIRFSDGAPLDAQAVKTAWERHLDPKVQSAAAATVKQLTLTVLDERRLSVKLPSPNANFDRMVVRLLNFVPSPRTLASDEALAASNTAPVGAGPYKLREWVPGDHMTFERNPDYWQRGKPHLDTVTMRISTDTSKDVQAIDDGEADLALTVDPVTEADAKDKGLGTSEIALSGGLSVAFNTRDKRPLANPDLRRAIALSLDTKDIDQVFYQGKGRPAKGIFESSSPLGNIQLSLPQNDPNQAAALYAQATDNGRKPVKLTYSVPNTPRSVQLAQYFKGRIDAASKGAVTVDLAVIDLHVYPKRVQVDADFDITTSAIAADDPEPTLYQYLHSKAGPPNLTGYQNAQVDAALEAARLSTDRTVRSEAYTRVQVELIKDIPFFVFQEQIAAIIASPKLTGMQLYGDGHILWDRIGLRA